MTAEPKPISLWKEWSALVPMGMSLASLALVLGHAVFFGVEPQEDEGTAAHLFQLLMSLQVPIVGYFAIRWLPKQFRSAVLILVAQGTAWLAAMGALYWLEHLAR